MANKNIQGRVQHKTDTSANWAQATSFIPLKGELIIYSDLNKFKIGDGVTVVESLPFATSDALPEQSASTVGKYLMSNTIEGGFQASWEEVDNGTVIRGTHTIVSGEESSFTSPIAIVDNNKTVVYHNGLLLNYGTNYTVSNNVITLIGYTAEIGDIFTVVTNGDGGTTATTNTYTETFTGPGSYSEGLTTFTITHNLKSMAVLVQVYDSTGANAICEVVRTSVNVVNLIFNGAVTSEQSFTVVVMSPTYKTIESAEQEEF